MSKRFSVSSIFKAIDRVTAPVAVMQNSVLKFTRATERGARRASKSLGNMASSFVSAAKTTVKYGAIGVGAITAAIGLMVREFTKIENAEAAFTPLLGGAERAKQLVAELNTLMVDTPFEFEALAGSASQLLPVMNGDIQKTIDTIKMLGDTAGGNAQKLDSVVRGYTKAMLKGKVDMESLNMIAEAGVPIFEDLAAVMGMKTGDKFFKMISAGKVSTAQLTAAFEKLTGEGGKFHNGMKISSETTTALWSGLKDNISQTAAELGAVMAPTIKELILQATELTKRLRTWVSANRELVSAKFLEFVEATKNVLIATGKALAYLYTHRETIVKVVATVATLIITLKTLAIVLGVINLVLLANPFGLIVAAIVAVIAVVAALIIWFDDIKAAFQDLPGWAQFAISPIFALVNALTSVWQEFGGTFKDIWAGAVDIVTTAANKIMGVMDKLNIFSGASPLLGAVDLLGGVLRNDDDEAGTSTPAQPQMVTPQARTAAAVEESRSTSFAELLIKDSTGRAELNKRGSAPGIDFRMVPTGGFE